jgi:hypothetical protein
VGSIKTIWDKSKEDIMNLPIHYLIIGTQPVSFSFNAIHTISNIFSPIRSLLPEEIGAKRFVHSSIFLALELDHNDKNKDLGALLEFGAYSENITSNRTDYIGKSGLRYSLVSRKLYEDYIEEENKYNYFTKYILLECEIHSKNSMKTVLEKIAFLKVKRDNLNEKDLSYLEKYFDEKSYDVLSNNCQTFVSKFIENSYSLLKYDYDYNELKLYIPSVVVNSLNKIKNLYKEFKYKIFEDNLEKKNKKKKIYKL